MVVSDHIYLRGRADRPASFLRHPSEYAHLEACVIHTWWRVETREEGRRIFHHKSPNSDEFEWA